MKEIAALRLLFSFQISEILQIIRTIGNTNGIDYGIVFGIVFGNTCGIDFECTMFKLLIICGLKKTRTRTTWSKSLS